MNLKIEGADLYADNLFLCHCEAGNGRPNLQPGSHEVIVQFSHEHGAVLPDAVGLGWLGATAGCDIVLGGVRGRHGVIPSPSSLGRLLALLESAENMGRKVMLEVRT